MKPTDIRRLKKAAWRIHDKGDVTDDPTLLDKALTHLMKLDAIEAASPPPDDRQGAITRVPTTCSSIRIGWRRTTSPP